MQLAISAPLLLAALYLVLVPSVGSQATTAHDLQRTLQVACLSVGALLLAIGNFSGAVVRPPPPAKVVLVLGSVLAAGVASALSAAHPLAGLQEIGLYIGLVTLALSSYRAAGREGAQRIMALASLASAAYFGVALSIFCAALAFGDPLNARLLNIGYSNPRFFNHAQSLMLPLVAGWSLLAPTRRKRTLALWMAALHFAWMGLDLARATALAVAVGIATCWVLDARRYATRLAQAGVLGVIVWILLFQLLPAMQGAHWTKSFASAGELTSAHSRGRLLELAWHMAAEHPLLGVGPMHFAATVNPTGAHPHNFYLQWAAEFGWPSALVVLSVLCAPVLRAVRTLRHNPALRDGQLPPLLAAAVAGLVDACFSGNFVMPIAQMWLAVVFGLLWGCTSPTPQPADVITDRAAPWRQRFLRLGSHIGLGILVASQLFLATQTWRQWKYDPPRIEAGSPLPAAGELSRPRFWLNGWI